MTRPYPEIGQFDRFSVRDRVQQQDCGWSFLPHRQGPEFRILNTATHVIPQNIVDVPQSAKGGAVQGVDVGLEQRFLEQRLKTRFVVHQADFRRPRGVGSATQAADPTLHIVQHSQALVVSPLERRGRQRFLRLHEDLGQSNPGGIKVPVRMVDEPGQARDVLGKTGWADKNHSRSAGVWQSNKGRSELPATILQSPALVGIQPLRANEIKKPPCGAQRRVGSPGHDEAQRIEQAIRRNLQWGIGMEARVGGHGAAGSEIWPVRRVRGLVRRTSIGYARTAHCRLAAGRFEMFQLNLRTRLAAAALLAAFVVVLGPSTPTALAAPEPSARPPRWELKFEVVHDLRLLELDNEYYWFMTYLVTNRTGEDQIFVPNAILATDAGDIVKDGEGVPYEITQKILKLMKDPFLESKNQIIGQLQTGKEYAREGLLVWKAGTLDDVRDVRVFFGGLSSDTQLVKNPVTGDNAVVRKHLARLYDCPGDPQADPGHAVELRKQEWIMR